MRRIDAVVGAHRRGRLDDLAVDRGEAERQRDERQRDEEDRVADHHRPRRAVEAERRPEGEEAERGDDRRQDEGRQPEHLEDPRPARAAAAIATRPAGRRSATESAAAERGDDDGGEEARSASRDRRRSGRTSRAKSRPAGIAASSAAFTDTPATMTIGAARKSATSGEEEPAAESRSCDGSPPADHQRQADQRRG